LGKRRGGEGRERKQNDDENDDENDDGGFPSLLFSRFRYAVASLFACACVGYSVGFWDGGWNLGSRERRLVSFFRNQEDAGSQVLQRGGCVGTCRGGCVNCRGGCVNCRFSGFHSRGSQGGVVCVVVINFGIVEGKSVGFELTWFQAECRLD
jgi:hypothetical protein